MPIWAIACLSIVGFFIYLLIGAILAGLYDGDGWDFGVITILWPVALPLLFFLFIVILVAEDIVTKIRGY